MRNRNSQKDLYPSLDARAPMPATNHQTGATMWGWLAVIFMVGTLGILAFKVVPIYTEHWTVRSALEDVVNSREFANMSSRQIVSTVSSRLTINNVRGIPQTAFKAKRDRSGERFIHVKYEQKVAVWENLYALVEFDEEVRARR